MALRDVARDLFAKLAPVSRQRELYDGAPLGVDAWRQIARVGLTGVGVAEDLGGMGGDATDLVMVLEEAGRAALPDPVTATLGIAVPTLVASGRGEADELLRAVARGDRRGVVRRRAVLPGRPGLAPA